MLWILSIALAADPIAGCQISGDQQKKVECPGGAVATQKPGDLATWMKRQLEDIPLNGRRLRGVRTSSTSLVVQTSLESKPMSVACSAPDETALAMQCPALVDFLSQPPSLPGGGGPHSAELRSASFASFTAKALGKEPEVPAGCKRVDAVSIDCGGSALLWGHLERRHVEAVLDELRPSLTDWQRETYERRCVVGGAPRTCLQLHLRSGEQVRNVVIAATGPEYFVQCRVNEELPAEGEAPGVCGQIFSFSR